MRSGKRKKIELDLIEKQNQEGMRETGSGDENSITTKFTEPGKMVAVKSCFQKNKEIYSEINV